MEDVLLLKKLTACFGIGAVRKDLCGDLLLLQLCGAQNASPNGASTGFSVCGRISGHVHINNVYVSVAVVVIVGADVGVVFVTAATV